MAAFTRAGTNEQLPLGHVWLSDIHGGMRLAWGGGFLLGVAAGPLWGTVTVAFPSPGLRKREWAEGVNSAIFRSS